MKYRTSTILALLLLCFSFINENRLQAGLIAHYPLDTISAGTTPDSTGINGDGILNGGVTLSAGAGKIGGAFEFTNSSSEFVGISDPAFGLSTVTASVWLNADALGNQGPLAQWTNGGPSPQSLLIRTGGSSLQAYIRDGAAQRGGTFNFPSETISVGEFSLLTVTLDGQIVQAYLNGQPSSNTYDFGSLATIGSGVLGTMAIGGRGSSERVADGLIDDVSFFNERLSDGKIAALFNLADQPALNYDASQVDQLFQVYDGLETEADIGGLTWVQDTGLGGTAGEVIDLGSGDFFLNLDGTTGVSTLSSAAAVPEPSTFLLGALGLLGLGWFCRRRRKA